MKKITLPLLIIALIGCALYFSLSNNSTETLMDQKRKKHEKFLAESPFNETKNLSKSERKKLGLPPNAFYEREWELTLNPEIGSPTPYQVDMEKIYNEALVDNLGKLTPGNANSPWIERGPLDIGGRTHVVFYDPNDVGANNGGNGDYNRIFAGAVSGGLWVNDDITDPQSEWRIIPGVASNLNVSSYAIDPIDSNIFYIGTGEQYTGGAAIGNGFYRSLDGGATWSEVEIPVLGLGQLNTNQSGALFSTGIFHINDILVRSTNNVDREIYVAVGGSAYNNPNSEITGPFNLLGIQNAGIYRSTDNGDSWVRIETEPLQFEFSNLPFPVIPNDFEVNADGTIYMSSITTPSLGQGGGQIFSSTDGLTWDLMATIPNGDRVEIEPSASDPNKFYILANVFNQADLFITTDNFANVVPLSEPSDADRGIPDSDFTRGQAFYDLVVEANPLDDSNLHIGGINMFSSDNSGNNWSQASKWSNNPDMNLLRAPLVHADIHALTFHPTDPNQAVIGTDGGVYWARSLNTAPTSGQSILQRTLGYNATQFYVGDIAQNNFSNGDEFIGGAQDNGTQVFSNSSIGNGLTRTTTPSGGDGSFSAIDDQNGDNYGILGLVRRTHFYVPFPIPFGRDLNSLIFSREAYPIRLDNENDNSVLDGDFINTAELDRDFNLFYANSRDARNINSITVIELLPNGIGRSSELIDNAIANGRPTYMKVPPFSRSSPAIYVGSEDSRLFRIENPILGVGAGGPLRFVDISGPDFLGSVSDIEFGTSEDEIYLTFHNYGILNVWFTNDGGATWEPKDGNLPDIPVKSILPNPLVPNEVIIGTEIGLYSTTDFDSDSPTWTLNINGMTAVKVLDLDLRTADNTVLATTHGRGMFTGKFTEQTASTTSVDASLPLSVYPTQATSEIFIESDQNFSDVNISIYNLNGQEVYRSTNSLSSNRERIDVSTLSTGIYFLKANGEGLDQTTKFLKQ